jgi:hypothetical protein
MPNHLRSPASIGDLTSHDPEMLRRVVFLAAEVRQRQRAYYKNRSAPNALELLIVAKDHEALLDIAIDAMTRGGQGALL